MKADVSWLLLEVSRGSTAALEQLYCELGSSVYGLALSLLADPAAAEDVLQDTFVRVFTMAAAHSPDKNGRSWIFTIARNLCLDRIKSPQYTVRQITEQEKQQTDSAALDFIADVELKEAVALLDSFSRSIVLLHLAAGFRFREIAQLLGEKQSSVQWTYYTAVKKLKAYYQPEL